MSKIKTLSIGLGVVAGLGVAILPLTAYADGEPSASANVDVNVRVATVISMALDTHSQTAAGGSTGELTCDSTAIVEDDPLTPEDESNDGCSGTAQVAAINIAPNSADLTTMYTNVYVSTNSAAGYTLTLIDADDDASLKTTGNDTIATINTTPVAGTAPGWAVSIDGGTTWQKMPKNAGTSTPAEAAITVKNHTPNPAAISTRDQSTVRYGVATAAAQPAGTYVDTITYTATAK
ncbi:hypothetical protein IKD60_01725 [Candidatus Saccharibacteria bacterium]|nr:hypothetical protein [Candidatus Saccharibacteria bacterium]